MAQRSTLLAAWILGLMLLRSASASADPLVVLHVRRFAMSADRAQVRVGEAFHLRIELQVDEMVAQCDNLTLPDFFGFDSLGDERRTDTRSTRTTCTEIITLSPTFPGSRTIAPATLDAVDATTRAASRFSTNTVMIQVLHAPLQTATIVKNTALQMLKAIILLMLATGVVAAAYAIIRRTLPGFAAVKRITPQETPSTPPQQTTPPIDEAQAWRAVVARLAAQPTRQNVLAVRMILRNRSRARDDEVFGELLARIAAVTDSALLDAMRAVERAAFIDDANLPDAVQEVIRALGRLTQGPEALS